MNTSFSSQPDRENQNPLLKRRRTSLVGSTSSGSASPAPNTTTCPLNANNLMLLNQQSTNFGGGAAVAAVAGHISPVPSCLDPLAASTGSFSIGRAGSFNVGGGGAASSSHLAGARSGDEPDTATTRLSRHVPPRDDMNMEMAAYNLANDSSSNNNYHHQLNNSSNDGMMNRFDSDRHFQDNNNNNNVDLDTSAHSSAMATVDSNHHNQHHRLNDSISSYRESLADGLVSGDVGSDVFTFGGVSSSYYFGSAIMNSESPPPGHRVVAGGGGSVAGGGAVSGGGGGGASSVIVAGGTKSDAGGGGGGVVGSSSVSSAAAAAAEGAARHNQKKRSESQRRPLTRNLNLNPEKVLDAPELPEEPCQILDWGAANKLVIGLNSTLYCWDAEDGNASTVTEIPLGQVITGVAWLRGDHQAAMCRSSSRISLVDMASGTYTRTLCPASDAGVAAPANPLDLTSTMSLDNNDNLSSIPNEHRIVTSMAVCGPLVAAATTLGTVALYDVRCPNIINHFDAHTGGGVAKATFCSHEPHYLATGGAADGGVRFWDYRNISIPRYAFDRVHAPGVPVSALCFFADKRSIIFSGGADGSLLALNTHGSGDNYMVCQAQCGPAPITGIVSSPMTGEIATSTGGVIQLRRAYKFHLLGQFSGTGTQAAINCLTLAPDGERVCGAQLDETLKFWSVFERPRSAHEQQQSLREKKQNTSVGGVGGGGGGQQEQQQNYNCQIQPGQRIRTRTVDVDGNEDDLMNVGLR